MPRERRIRRTARSGTSAALAAAALLVFALALLWVVAEFVPAVRVKDAVALHDFTLIEGAHIQALAKFLPHLLDPLLFTIWALALVLFALAGDRTRVALAVACVMALAPLSSELLKPLLAQPHVSVDGTFVGAASWPSGHATAAGALALCAVLVAPSRLRPAAAVLGAIFALSIGAALLIRAWHMPSDVLGGYLMAALWMSLAVAALRASEPRAKRSRSAP